MTERTFSWRCSLGSHTVFFLSIFALWVATQFFALWVAGHITSHHRLLIRIYLQSDFQAGKDQSCWRSISDGPKQGNATKKASRGGVFQDFSIISKYLLPLKWDFGPMLKDKPARLRFSVQIQRRQFCLNVEMEHNWDCETGERVGKEGEVERGKQLTEGQNSSFSTSFKIVSGIDLIWPACWLPRFQHRRAQHAQVLADIFPGFSFRIYHPETRTGKDCWLILRSKCSTFFIFTFFFHIISHQQYTTKGYLPV